MVFWLITWLALTALLLAGLLLVNLYSRWRSLAVEGVPHPALVIWRQAFGRLLPVHVEPISKFVGRKALVSWDIRWVTAGRTLADVTGADTEAGELELHLANPIHLVAVEKAPEVYLDKVRFQPRNMRHQAAYGTRSVSGRLLPSVGEGLYASASVVVYPSGAYKALQPTAQLLCNRPRAVLGRIYERPLLAAHGPWEGRPKAVSR